MPIKPENRARYPRDWRQISERIRYERAGNACEWCGAENHEPHPDTGSTVVLTVAHHHEASGPEDCRPEVLSALCQRCHNEYDGPMRREHARATVARKKHEAFLSSGQTAIAFDANKPHLQGGTASHEDI